MIQKINYIITRVFDIILYPFGFINPIWGVLFLSILMAFVVLVVYKKISSPKTIKITKEKIKANILAIRIYKDFWKVILSSFFKSLYYTGKYFSLNLVPLLVIVPILFPVFVQMDVRYGMRPFRVGEEIVIKVRVSLDPHGLEAQLIESGNFKSKMNPVFINGFRDEKKQQPIKEIDWKVEAVRAGASSIQVKINNRAYEKSLVIGNYSGALSNRKYSESSWGHFIYPVEGLFGETGVVEDIYIEYPGATISFAGLRIHWLIYNIVLVVIIALAFRKRFGIEF
jgi:hypothetical protein